MKHTPVCVCLALVSLATGCSFAPHKVDALYEEFFGIGKWQNTDTAGFIIGLAHVARAIRTPQTNMTPNTLFALKPQSETNCVCGEVQVVK